MLRGLGWVGAGFGSVGGTAALVLFACLDCGGGQGPHCPAAKIPGFGLEIVALCNFYKADCESDQGLAGFAFPALTPWDCRRCSCAFSALFWFL